MAKAAEKIGFMAGKSIAGVKSEQGRKVRVLTTAQIFDMINTMAEHDEQDAERTERRD